VCVDGRIERNWEDITCGRKTKIKETERIDLGPTHKRLGVAHRAVFFA
jgi:hypothetical protein